MIHSMLSPLAFIPQAHEDAHGHGDAHALQDGHRDAHTHAHALRDGVALQDADAHRDRVQDQGADAHAVPDAQGQGGRAVGVAHRGGDALAHRRGDALAHRGGVALAHAQGVSGFPPSRGLHDEGRVRGWRSLHFHRSHRHQH
jgi:hypothetical protein